MEPTYNAPPIPDKNTLLLQKVNQILESLGSTSKYKRLSEKVEGCEALKGKKVMMIDDVLGLLEQIIPELMVATDGNAQAVLHRDQTLGGLVKAVLENNPDIILIDQDLNNNAKGSELLPLILHHRPESFCVGFSSDKDNARKFLAAGARGFVEKSSYDTEGCLQELAKLVEKK